MIPFYYIHYEVDLQFHNTFTMPFCKLQEKSKKRIGKKTFVGVDIEEMQVHNNSLCLFVFLSYVKLKKKSEDARTETDDKLFRYAFGTHLINGPDLFVYAVFFNL